MKMNLKLLLATTLIISAQSFASSPVEESQGDASPSTQSSPAAIPSYGKVMGEKAQAFIKAKVPYGDAIVATTTCVARNGFGSESLTEGMYNHLMGAPKTEVPTSVAQAQVKEEIKAIDDDGFLVINNASSQEPEEVIPLNNNASALSKLWTGIWATAGCAFTTETGARIVGAGAAKFVENFIPYGPAVVKATGFIAGKIDPKAATFTEAAIRKVMGIGNTPATEPAAEPTTQEEGAEEAAAQTLAVQEDEEKK